MTDRIVQLYISKDCRDDLKQFAKKENAVAHWAMPADEGNIYFNLLVEAYQTQKILDHIQDKYEKDDYHLLILPVEAYLPRPNTAEDEDEAAKAERQQAQASIVREELENDLIGQASFDRNFVLLIVFAAIVASIGMIENNVAVIVGSMVIAPFLGPNLALTFASAMGNRVLAWRALRTLGLGSLIAFGCGGIVGQFWPINDIPSELAIRATVDYSAIFLALAAGASASLSLTKGISSIMVGVMVAAALLPPLAAGGVFLGHGYYASSASTMVLFGVNVVCINLAALAIFILRGIGPRTWYEKREAKKSVYLAAGIWGIALLALIGAIYDLNVSH